MINRLISIVICVLFFSLQGLSCTISKVDTLPEIVYLHPFVNRVSFQIGGKRASQKQVEEHLKKNSPNAYKLFHEGRKRNNAGKVYSFFFGFFCLISLAVILGLIIASWAGGFLALYLLLLGLLSKM